MRALVCLMVCPTTQIDCILAFPQAPAKTDVYMNIPKDMALVIYNLGENIIQSNSNYYTLQLHRNLYGSKVDWRFRNDYQTKKLIQEVRLY